MEFIFNGHSLHSGIYRITNKINGRTYYGSAKEFKSRWNGHLSSLKAGKGSNRFLQADFIICGTNAFIVEVLEVTTGTKDERLAREQVYLDANCDGGKLCYNFMKSAKSPEGRIMKDEGERCRKISEAMKGRVRTPDHQARLNLTSASAKGHPKSPEQIAKQSATMTGRTLSDEHKAAISVSLMGRVVTPETRAKISEANKGQVPTPECIAAGILANTGKVPSDETIAKRALALVGNKSRTGQTNSEETRAKMREAHAARRDIRLIQGPSAAQSAATLTNLARMQTPEARAKMAEAKLGTKHSEETKAKMRAAHTPNGGQFKPGHMPSDEARAKMSKALEGNKFAQGNHHRLGIPVSEETKAKMRATIIGKKHSEETKAKMKASHASRKAFKLSLERNSEEVASWPQDVRDALAGANIL